MSSKTKLHFLISLTTLATLSGCGGGAGSKDPSGYSINAQMSAVQNLTAEERAIATRICYAYQSKSSSFRGMNYNGGTFNFSVDSRNCVDAKETYSITSILKATSTSMVLETSSEKPFYGTIQTSSVGLLSQLCSKMQNNLPVSNTATDGKVKIQVGFFRDTLDSYTLRYFSPSSSDASKMVITSAETFKVRTQFNISGTQILGMDEKYSVQQTCGTSEKYSEFNQNFTSFVK